MAANSHKRDLEAVLKKSLEGEVRFDTLSRMLYSTDASNYQIEPVGVVVPRSAEDVIKTVETCTAHGVPMLPRGGGTSLAGQAVGHAVVMDYSKYMNNVLEVDTEARTVRTEPGIYLEQLNLQMRRYRLMFGPDPSTARVATVGGAVGNNSTGAHSILYGMAGDNVIAAKAIVNGTEYMDLQMLSEKDFEARARGGGLFTKLYDLRNEYSGIIGEQFPRHWRRASGYSLNYFLEAPFNPARLLAGSEGTLGIVTELTLKLVPKPAFTGLSILQFGNVLDAMQAVPLMLKLNPSAVELIDSMLICLTRQHATYRKMLSFVEGEPEALLVVEFYGESEAEIRGKIQNVTAFVMDKNIRCTVTTAVSPEAQANVWGVRRAGLGLIMSTRNEHRPITCIEDLSVPVEQLPAFVADITALFKRLGIRAAFYGHASAGCLHIRPLVNLKSGDGVTLMKELMEEGLKLVLKYGGVLSGEHGDGIQRSYLNAKLFGPELYGIMKELKTTFDPGGLFNPGKVVNASQPNENLRYDQTYKPYDLKTYLDWSSDNGFAGGVEMCNGQGVCRKLGEGIMCPSYMATRDERDTTRARANALRAVLSGRKGKEYLMGRDMKKVFDLCISCKACKSECPSGVDAAKMKLEFLAHHNEKNGIRLRDRFFGDVHRASVIASRAPALSNLLIDNPVTKSLMSALGVASERSLPLLAEESFTNWFMKRKRVQRASTHGKAIYFHDTWAGYYQPEAGKAAVDLFEAAGFEVVIVENRECCGRPMLSKGILEPVKEMATRNASLLAPYAKAGIPVVGTEPSCILTFRDEYPHLLPGDENVEILSKNSYMLDEFLYGLHSRGELEITWKPDGPNVLYHGHCHERALKGTGTALEMLRLAGCTAWESGAGCCGMAGSFGYESEHYGISRIIGEDRLFPAVRQAGPETVIAVSGVSCRHQIEHFTERKTKHIAEVLAERIK